MEPTTTISPEILPIIGAGLSITLSIIGSSYATTLSSKGVQNSNQGYQMKAMIGVVISGVLSIYGVIVAVFLGNKANYCGNLVCGMGGLVGGLVCGISNMFAGYAVGKINEDGLSESSNFKLIILCNIYAEALGLYGLIVALIIMSL
eukprot:TRINITY_DN11239_c0_g1_i1.p1 TRINITY_DN11239_c0_g1~~TRINITY_DN11239_c0_g1_i1.p1  ORF type:complete len:147 (-),score=11.34 TRINITY_DN11239_c0_g1_i1:67-507(-)